MKNFGHLLVKEIKELVNKQLIISLAMMILIFSFIGNVTKKEIKKPLPSRKLRFWILISQSYPGI